MSAATTAVLLMNLGSPDSTSVKDLKTYLTQFLMDERVIDKPKWLRTLLVKGLIVPLRAPKSAHAYESIWTDEGSPLIVITRHLQAALAGHTDWPIEICMRYGNPSPQAAMDALRDAHPNLKEVILVPLYPHYAWSSYETAVVYALEQYSSGNYPFALRVVPPFYDNEEYLNALSESIRPYVADANYDLLVFSYHGIPERHITKRHPAGVHNLQTADACCGPEDLQQYCYRHQVIATTQEVARRLNLPQNKYTITFQSRLGRDPWLLPFTAASLEKWPSQGIKKVAVVCPAFVSDCLETIEEMGVEGSEIFRNAGGESFTLIPCMNVLPQWTDALWNIIQTAVPAETQTLLEKR